MGLKMEDDDHIHKHSKDINKYQGNDATAPFKDAAIKDKYRNADYGKVGDRGTDNSPSYVEIPQQQHVEIPDNVPDGFPVRETDHPTQHDNTIYMNQRLTPPD
jgi:hypothetical protein